MPQDLPSLPPSQVCLMILTELDSEIAKITSSADAQLELIDDQIEKLTSVKSSRSSTAPFAAITAKKIAVLSDERIYWTNLKNGKKVVTA